MANFTTRPVVMSARGVVTSGHYLVTSVGFQILARGGNAIDAAAAMGICETLLEPPVLRHRWRGGETHSDLLGERGQDLLHIRHGMVCEGFHH